MVQSTKQKRGAKPKKPYKDFPLYAHSNGQWAKKIRGKLHYFGCWAEPMEALTLYQEQREDLHAGRTPLVNNSDELTARQLVNEFLTAKEHQIEVGELSQRTFNDYYTTGERIVKKFGDRVVEGLRPADFLSLRKGIARTRGPVALGNEVQRIRTIFKYAYDAMLIENPVRFGPLFKKPARRVLRAVRQAAGPRMYDAREICTLIKAARVNLKAMILLGINAGCGNSDCGNLPLRAVDLKQGWIDYPRPKTSVERRVPIWPETITALKQVLEHRPQPGLLNHCR